MRYRKRFEVHMLLIMAALTGCTGPSADGNTNDDSGTSSEDYALVRVETSIGGEPEACGAVVEQDGDTFDYTAGGDGVGDEFPVIVGKPFTVKAGNRSVKDRDGNPLHVRTDGTYWYSPPVTQTIPKENAVAEVIPAPLAFHLQGSAVYCDVDVWELDTDAPDLKGEFIGSDRMGPYNVQTVGYAEYSYMEDNGNWITYQGAQLVVYNEGGGRELAGETGTLVMVNDQLYIQDDDALGHYITAFETTITRFSWTNVRMDGGILEAVCSGFDADRE